MLDWGNFLIGQEHRKDLLREAERERLARQSLAGRERSDSLYGRTLIWLGRRMVAWGKHLQEHYGDASPAPNSVAILKARAGISRL